MTKPHDEMTFSTAPNFLTLSRIAFVPVVVAMLFKDDPTWNLAAAAVFMVASATDYFDGYLARTRKLITVYGKLLDPLADKFLVVSSLIMLQHLGRIHPIVVILLICRELAITALRALASAEGVIIAASDSAKLKTATQMLAIPCLMVQESYFGIPFFWIGQILIYVSLGISLWSAKDYIVSFFKALKISRKEKAERRKALRKNRRGMKFGRRASDLPGTSTPTTSPKGDQ